MKKLFTLLLTLILSLSACFGLTACGKTFTGFDIELATSVFEYLSAEYGAPIRVEFQEINWDSKQARPRNLHQGHHRARRTAVGVHHYRGHDQRHTRGACGRGRYYGRRRHDAYAREV